MMTTDSKNAKQLSGLEGRFDVFNQLSEQLAESYHQLQNQIQELPPEALSVTPDRDVSSIQLENHQLTDRMDCLLQALPAGVVVLDACGVVQEYNPAAVDLLGVLKKGVVWRDVIARVFAPRYDDGHDVSLIDGRRISISTNALKGEAGQIIVLKDVTETRQLQEKLTRHQRLSGMGQMAASLAHQIRTPVASALLYTSQLSNRSNDENRVIYCADKVRQQLRHIEAMVNDMLGYSKGDMGQSRHAEFHCSALLDNVANIVSAQVEAKQGVLNINVAADALLLGHIDELAGVLSNIVMNALQACKNDAYIVLDSYCQEGRLILAISDNGVGIATDIQAQMFDAFVTNRSQGTGLGLAIAKQVVHAHGGHITYETELNKGTTFFISLPLFQRTMYVSKEKA